MCNYEAADGEIERWTVGQTWWS